jgi:hypothetical protein
VARYHLAILSTEFELSLHGQSFASLHLIIHQLCFLSAKTQPKYKIILH